MSRAVQPERNPANDYSPGQLISVTAQNSSSVIGDLCLPSHPFLADPKSSGKTRPLLHRPPEQPAVAVTCPTHSCRACAQYQHLKDSHVISVGEPAHGVSTVSKGAAPATLALYDILLGDCRRYTLIVVFAFTVLVCGSLLKYLEAPSTKQYEEVPDFRACAILNAVCFAALSLFSIVTYLKSEWKKRSGSHTEGWHSARLARDSALVTLGCGIGVGISAAAMVQSY